MKRLKLALLVAGLMMSLPPALSHATPTLQLYIEGSVYDSSDQSWVIDASDFTLWVLGNVSSDGTIFDVKLSAAYATSEAGAGSSISISPTQAALGILPAPGDPSPSAALSPDSSGDGNAPLLGNGTPLPSHGVFGPGTSWESWALGDFTLTDSPIGDFTNGGCPDGPACEYPSMGQINAYNISITGYSSVHFDAFDHIGAENHFKYRKAPFSHDAVAVPEPGALSLTLLGSGLLGAWALRKTAFKR
ncbi:MAG: choice-of-anchor N protein [Sideroxyarcus sp.]|nr:choice-of-anchor N protein [Sideroxyarcus sp.]